MNSQHRSRPTSGQGATTTTTRDQGGLDAGLATRFAVEVGPRMGALKRHARRLTNSPADAEDLLQEALLHAYKGFHTFTHHTNLDAWLFCILRNRWASGYRRKMRRPTEMAFSLIEDWDVARSGVTASAESEAMRTLTDRTVKDSFTTLPLGVQKVLYYTAMCGYTHAETAAIMGIPQGTVMSRAARGRQKLRELLAHYDA